VPIPPQALSTWTQEYADVLSSEWPMLVQDMRSTAPDGTTVATRRNVHEPSGRNHHE
jgi:hypothetical protein